MDQISRRNLCKIGAGLFAGTMVTATMARADDLQTKESVSYQTTPSDGMHCSQCKNFIPGAAGADGTCKVVAGDISPNGYCLAFSPA
jgi:hypothetical protein